MLLGKWHWQYLRPYGWIIWLQILRFTRPFTNVLLPVCDACAPHRVDRTVLFCLFLGLHACVTSIEFKISAIKYAEEVMDILWVSSLLRVLDTGVIICRCHWFNNWTLVASSWPPSGTDSSQCCRLHVGVRLWPMYRLEIYLTSKGLISVWMICMFW